MTESALPPDAPLEGVLLRGRYRVDSKLGQGGMATVYMATDEELGRKAVVKVPLMRLMDMEGFHERFELEIKGMTEVEHPHVVSILARGEHEGQPYFVIQYLKGGSLEDRILEATGGLMAPKEITKWLPFVADALDFINGQGIVHRDVKPANILFDAAGNVMLSDFGVAKALGTQQDNELTAAGSTVGSPEYMAPEQITNEVGPATDQYALAVSVYECLSGELPFQGENVLEVLMAKRQKQPQSLHERCGTPKEISDVVNRALAPIPQARFESCTAFSAAFEQAVWALDPTPAPGMRTPRSAGYVTPAGAEETPLTRTMGGSPDFTAQLLLGHYKVGAKLGRGGMGTVYLAVDTDLGKNVVIKVPHYRLLAEKGFVARFEREVKQLLKLEHPSVVRVLARGEQQGIPFYVLQYMKEGSLRDRMKRAPDGKMGAEDILAWFESTARALDFLHSRHLIHRDVKPGNILFDEHEHAYLSDFGIAKVHDESDQHLTTTSTGVGSPRYMAPEQTGEKFDGNADQYALATTVFEALTGRVPFEDGTAMEIMLKKMQEQPPSVADLVDGVPEPAAVAISKALAPKSDDRFPTCRAFFLAFKRGLRGEVRTSLLDRPTQLAESPLETPPQTGAPPTKAPLELEPESPAPAPKKKAAAKKRAAPRPPPEPEHEPEPSTRPRAREQAPVTTAASRLAGLWQPTFVLAFVGVWLLARLSPFARFALPHDLLADVPPDVIIVLWACVPPALIIAIGHGWLFQTRGVTPAWAWVLATLIGASVAAVALLMYPRMMDTGLRIHPLGVISAAVTAAALGICQWLALIERSLKKCHLWFLLTVVGGAAAAALIEFVGGGGGERDFGIVVAAALVMAAFQLYALRRMAPRAKGTA